MSGKANLYSAIFCVLLAASSFAQSKQSNTSNKDFRFLEDISADATAAPTVIETSRPLRTEVNYAVRRDASMVETSPLRLEKASSLQFKYALLLNVEVEMVKNLNLFRLIDDWYGVRYQFGGLTKYGIDCSALMQVFFTALYGIALPRTARDQYNFSRRISRTELREGDLVFFNTVGGISHVGMYLANNKFVHASANGVVISSLYDDYYARRFVGVGRVDAPQTSSSF